MAGVTPAGAGPSGSSTTTLGADAHPTSQTTAPTAANIFAYFITVFPPFLFPVDATSRPFCFGHGVRSFRGSRFPQAICLAALPESAPQRSCAALVVSRVQDP